MNKWIRSKDKVVVITGNDKGITGEVIAKKDDRVLVKGANIRKKHMKRTQKNQNAQIVSFEAPIHISNVRLCDEEGKALKVRLRVNKDKSRDLVYTKKGKDVVLRTIKKRVK